MSGPRCRPPSSWFVDGYLRLMIVGAVCRSVSRASSWALVGMAVGGRLRDVVVPAGCVGALCGLGEPSGCFDDGRAVASDALGVSRVDSLAGE